MFDVSSRSFWRFCSLQLPFDKHDFSYYCSVLVFIHKSSMLCCWRSWFSFRGIHEHRIGVKIPDTLTDCCCIVSMTHFISPCVVATLYNVIGCLYRTVGVTEGHRQVWLRLQKPRAHHACLPREGSRVRVDAHWAEKGAWPLLMRFERIVTHARATPWAEVMILNAGVELEGTYDMRWRILMTIFDDYFAYHEEGGRRESMRIKGERCARSWDFIFFVHAVEANVEVCTVVFNSSDF